MRIYIEDDYKHRNSKFFLIDKRGRTDVAIGYDGENLVEQILPQLPEPVGFEIKPLLSIPMDFKQVIISAFINAGAEIQLRTENENLLKGKLEATELHLSDMREFTKILLGSQLENQNHEQGK